MKTKDFYYDLPEELIAQVPIENRDNSRLLVLDKESGNIDHKHFKDIIYYLEAGDTLVLNDTRVLPARLFGNRPGKEEAIEFLLLKRTEDDVWESLVKPGKKARIGHQIEFGGGLLKGEIIGYGEGGTRFIKFQYEGIFEEILDQWEKCPTPLSMKLRMGKGIRRSFKHPALQQLCVLHFTEELLEEIKARGYIALSPFM